MIINQDFDFFSGHMKTEEFINWLEEVEEYFDYRRITESLKVLCVEDCLKNDALIWWEDFQKDRKRFGMGRIQSWPVMKQVMQEEYLPDDYFEDFCYAENIVEDISYEVETVEGIEDDQLILEVEDCDLTVVEAQLEAKSISIEKVSEGDNLFENPHNFFRGNLKIASLHSDFEDPTLFLPSEESSFKPVIDKVVHLKYYPPKQNLAKLDDEFFLRGGEYYVGWEKLIVRNRCHPNLCRCPAAQVVTDRHRQWQIAWASFTFRWRITVVPLWIWDELRIDFSVGVYHSHKTNRGFLCLLVNPHTLTELEVEFFIRRGD